MLTAYGAEVVVTPDRRRARQPRVVLRRLRPARARDPGRVQARPVLEPERARSATTRPPVPRSGATPTARSRTSSPASAPAARSPAPAGTCARSSGDTVRIIGADPEGSVYSGGTGRPYLVEGVGEDFWPAAYDPTVADEIIAVIRRRVVRDDPAARPRGGHARRRVERHGRRRRRSRPRATCRPDAVVVVLLPDGGRGYLGKIFNDKWMRVLRLPATRRRRAHGRRRPRGQGRRAARASSRAPERHRARRDRQHDRVRRLAAARAVRRAARRDGRGRRRDRTRTQLLDAVFRGRPSSRTRSPSVVGEPLPLIGVNESVAAAREALADADALLVTDGGKAARRSSPATTCSRTCRPDAPHRRTRHP